MTPNPDRCRELGMIFLSLAESEPPECKVDMYESSYWACGTVACHAGWFGVSQLGKRNYRRYSYDKAADDMARFLDCECSYSLRNWAQRNPSLWGNDAGDGMFGTGFDFFRKPFGVMKPTLKHIGKHWLKVADRIEENK